MKENFKFSILVFVVCSPLILFGLAIWSIGCAHKDPIQQEIENPKSRYVTFTDPTNDEPTFIACHCLDKKRQYTYNLENKSVKAECVEPTQKEICWTAQECFCRPSDIFEKINFVTPDGMIHINGKPLMASNKTGEVNE